MQAAIGCAQLEKLPGFIEARQRNWQYLKDNLKDMDKYLILPEATENSSPSWFGFMMTVKKDAPFTRDQLVRHLEENKIQTRMLFAGNLTKHPCFDEMRNSKSGYRIIDKLKNTDNIMNNSFWVGVYPGMTNAKLSEIAKHINTFIDQGGI